jgi:hypothetical protein
MVAGLHLENIVLYNGIYMIYNMQRTAAIALPV